MQKTKKEEFDPQTLDNTTPEPAVDTSTDAGAPADESFQEELVTDKMAEDWQDKYVRLSAEFDNFRKRTLKEKADIAAYGGAEVLKAMLTTADDFERALQHIANEDDRKGVELVYHNFLSTLRSKGVTQMELAEKPFDVDTAEAIAKMPAPDPALQGTVMEVVEKGYMLKDKVLRFAKVVVYDTDK